MEDLQQEELTQEQLAEAKQEIRDSYEAKKMETNEEVSLPSEEVKETEPRVYAGVYKNVDELKKGIANLGSTLPEYVLNGMNEDALEKYYIDLRRDFSSKKKEERVDNTKVDETNKPKTVSSELWSDLDKTFTETGGITEEQYKALDKAGIPKNVVDNYINGLKAQQTSFVNELVEIAGGVEQYDAMKLWAEENYTQEELDIITSGTPKEVALKVKGLKAEYLASVGNNTKATSNYDRVRGTGKSSSDGYATQQEWMQDRMDRRYRTDARYKAKVDSKFKSSSFAS